MDDETRARGRHVYASPAPFVNPRDRPLLGLMMATPFGVTRGLEN